MKQGEFKLAQVSGEIKKIDYIPRLGDIVNNAKMLQAFLKSSLVMRSYTNQNHKFLTQSQIVKRDLLVTKLWVFTRIVF